LERGRGGREEDEDAADIRVELKKGEEQREEGGSGKGNEEVQGTGAERARFFSL